MRQSERRLEKQGKALKNTKWGRAHCYQSKSSLHWILTDVITTYI